MGEGRRLLAVALAVALLVAVVHGCGQSRVALPTAASVDATVLEPKLDEALDRLEKLENALEELETKLDEIQSDLEDVKLHLDIP